VNRIAKLSTVCRHWFSASFCT